VELGTVYRTYNSLPDNPIWPSAVSDSNLEMAGTKRGVLKPTAARNRDERCCLYRQPGPPLPLLCSIRVNTTRQTLCTFELLRVGKRRW
ncbi:unnamed protein product, partial [Ectocarpus sp. 12 AP-2014]